MLKRLKKSMPLLMVVALLVVSAVPAFAGPKGPTLVDVAIAVNDETGLFDTLLAAVGAADPAVLATLSGNGQHTVFAPTDAAFAELGFDETNIGDLRQEALTEILLYHVAPGRRYAEDVVESERIRTLLKGKDGFLMQEGAVLTDNLGRTADIILTDVEAANGIIHVINAVVLPYAP
jgi:uncharacterized surface protein with fasciclin (FAS1) repeats